MYIVAKTFTNADGKSTISILPFSNRNECNSFMTQQKKLFCEEIIASEIEFDNETVIIKSISASFADGTNEYMEVKQMCNGDHLVIYEEL